MKIWYLKEEDLTSKGEDLICNGENLTSKVDDWGSKIKGLTQVLVKVLDLQALMNPLLLK